LVVGTLIYNEVIQIPFSTYEPKGDKSLVTKTKKELDFEKAWDEDSKPLLEKTNSIN